MTQSQITRSRVMRRIGVAVAATIAISTLASTGSQAASNPSAPKYGGEVKVGIFDTFPGFCVGNNPANSSLMATRTVYETLFEKTRGNDFVGLLAKSGNPSPDLKTWTIELRSGIKFHNGEALNAKAMVTNWLNTSGMNFLLTAGAKGPAAATAAYGHTLGTAVPFQSNILMATAVGETTVVYTLDRPQNDFLGTLYASGRGFVRAPAQLIDKTTCSGNPIGTGPFKAVSFTTDEMIVEKNADYWVKTRTKGEGKVSTSLVGPSNIMYTKSGFQKYSVKNAKKFVAAYKKETGATELRFGGPSDTSSVSVANAKFFQTMMKKCGIKYDFVTEEGAVIIGKTFNPSPAAGSHYNAYDAISILLFEGTDTTFNLPFILTNGFAANSKSPLAGVFRTSIGSILGLNHHSNTDVDKLFYEGQAAQSKSLAASKYKAGTALLQKQAIMGATFYFSYELFAGKSLGGIGKTPIELRKTQRLMTNWGIDWAGVYKN